MGSGFTRGVGPVPRTFLQMYYVARPIDCGAGLLRCLSALEEAAFSAPRNGLCELREPSAASGGRSEAEAQCARELQEAALALVKNPAEGGGGWARSALKERGPGPLARATLFGCRKSGLRHFFEVFIAPLRLRRGQGAMQRNPCYARLFADLPYTPPNPIIASGGCGPRTPKGFSTG